MQTVFDEVIEKVATLTPEEKDELLRRLLELDKQIKEKEKKSKAADKTK